MSSLIAKVLGSHSTQRYFIEFNGYLSNHIAHGIIALHRLGASESRIERFISWYNPKLEPTDSDVIDDRPVEELKGKRVAFYKIEQHFEALLRDKYKNVDDLIKHEYPKLSKGLAGSALHGTIHLGYGYSIGNEKIILEGLAYTFHSYRPIETTKSIAEFNEFGNGSFEITEVLEKLRANKDLHRQMKEAIKEGIWKEMKIGKFQICVCYLLHEHGDYLTDLALSVKFGKDVRGSDSSLDPVKLGRRLVYASVLVYTLSASRNNFFLLHGVTCAWALYQIIPLLSKEDGITALREFLTVLLTVYVREGLPELNIPLTKDEFTEKDWAQLIDKTIGEDRDEHCYKLVQVCHDMVKDARENGEDPKVYCQGATTAIDYELYFYKVDSD